MNVVQGTFTEDLARGYPGMQANGELSNIVSRHLEGSAAVAFGQPVFRGAGDKGIVPTVSANLEGFALARKGLPVTENRDADTFAAGDTVPVLERGVMFVTSTTATAKGEQVYITAAGALTNSSGGNQAATGWFFDATITAPGLTAIARR